jgi:uncharacterized protein (TIGR02466 family)
MDHKVNNLFSIPLYTSKLDPIDPVTMKKLKAFEYTEQGYLSYDDQHFETSDRHILDHEEFKSLRYQIQKHVDHFVYEVIGVEKKQRWEITTSWVNKSPPKEGNHFVHYYANSLISGVLYLEVNQDTGAICFHKDKFYNNLWGETLCIDFETVTEYNTKVIGITPSQFDILLFPSFLTHSVLNNDSDIDRYSLAFNVFPRGTIGEGGNGEIAL